MAPPRTDAARFRLAAYPLQAAMPTRPGTTTRDHHVSNVALAGVYDDGRKTLLDHLYPREVRGAGLRPLLVQTSLNYRAEVVHPCTLVVATAAGAAGRSSFGMLQALFVDGACVGFCDSTFVNYGRSGPEPLSARHRELLAQFGLSAQAASES
jgi:acyl-CoA thioester hydrolase